jgi:hypothetical protein
VEADDDRAMGRTSVVGDAAVAEAVGLSDETAQLDGQTPLDSSRRHLALLSEFCLNARTEILPEVPSQHLSCLFIDPDGENTDTGGSSWVKSRTARSPSPRAAIGSRSVGRFPSARSFNVSQTTSGIPIAVDPPPNTP